MFSVLTFGLVIMHGDDKFRASFYFAYLAKNMKRLAECTL